MRISYTSGAWCEATHNAGGLRGEPPEDTILLLVRPEGESQRGWAMRPDEAVAMIHVLSNAVLQSMCEVKEGEIVDRDTKGTCTCFLYEGAWGPHHDPDCEFHTQPKGRGHE